MTTDETSRVEFSQLTTADAVILNERSETRLDSTARTGRRDIPEPILGQTTKTAPSVACIVISRAIIPRVIIAGLIYRGNRQETQRAVEAYSLAYSSSGILSAPEKGQGK